MAAIAIFTVLASAGGIEENSGPAPTENIYKQQQAVKALIAVSKQHQQENSLKLDQVNSGIAALGAWVSSLEVQVHEISEIQNNWSTIESTVNRIKSYSISFCDHLTEMSSVVDDMANRMRRNNLILKGLEELENGKWDYQKHCYWLCTRKNGNCLGRNWKDSWFGSKTIENKSTHNRKIFSFPKSKIFSESFQDKKCNTAKSNLWRFFW